MRETRSKPIPFTHPLHPLTHSPSCLVRLRYVGAFDLIHNKVDDGMLTRAHKLLAPIMLRRLKSQVENRLPPKV